MTRRYAWAGVLAILILPDNSAAADGVALLNRMHVGRVKAMDLRENRLIIEGKFHDGSFREIPVIVNPDAAIVNPDLLNRTRAVAREEIQPASYVALECTESGKRHAAQNVTITSTDEEERLQRAFMKARRAAPPGLRGMGGKTR